MNLDNLIVVGHRVLIKPEIKEATTESGIYIGHADTYKREVGATQIGTIVGIGPNAWLDFKPGIPWAKIGDRVYYAKYSGKEIKNDNGDIIAVIINDEDVQCKIVGE
jgi:chaperonin GroES